uniref:Ketohexokinase n=1 Tax=Anser brachyrhynchus TaxID=132585 RepID=A0A8B9CNF4_9AVES
MAAGAAALRDPGAGPAAEKRILCVGLVCLDIISVVEAYPAEDTDTRYRGDRADRAEPGRAVAEPCPSRAVPSRAVPLQVPVAAVAAGRERLQLVHGAGAAGSPLRLHGLAGPRARCRVSGCGDRVGAPRSPGGSRGRRDAAAAPVSRPGSFVLADLRRRGVDVRHAVLQPGGHMPTSVVIASASRGTRTILHASGNLPDVTARDFARVDLDRYHWIHWEARNASEQVRMIQRVEEHNRALPPAQRIRTSVEVEKPREELLPLLAHGDVGHADLRLGRGGGRRHGARRGAGARGRLPPRDPGGHAGGWGHLQRCRHLRALGRAEPAGRAQLRLPHRGQEVRDPGLRRHRLSRTCGCHCPPPRSLAPLALLPIKFLGAPPLSLVPGPEERRAPTLPAPPQ